MFLLYFEEEKSCEFSGILHASHRFYKFRSATIFRENNKKTFYGRIQDTVFKVFLNFETKRLYTIKWKITRAQRKTSLKLISCNSNVKPKSKISCNLKWWVLSRHSFKTMASKQSKAKDNFRTFFCLKKTNDMIDNDKWW